MISTLQKVVDLAWNLTHRNAQKDTSPQNFTFHDVDQWAEFFGMGDKAGSAVTAKNSLKLSIVYACMRLISGIVQQMPVKVYQRNAEGESTALDMDDPLQRLLMLQPTSIYSAALFWEHIVLSVLAYGDAYAIIARSNRGVVVELIPVHSTNMTVERINNRLAYAATDYDGQLIGYFDQDDVLHFSGFGFDGKKSMSVIQWGARSSISLQRSMEEYSADFFDNGAHQSLAMIKKGNLSDKQKEDLKKSFVQHYSGIKNKRFPLILDSSIEKFQTISVSQKDAQLLESRDYQITDIARAFGVPSFLVNQESKNTSFGSGLTEIHLSFMRYTVSPHTNRWEQELNRKLFMRSRRYCQFNAGGILRGTQKERFANYKEALGSVNSPGFMSVNEVRAMENLPKFSDEVYNRPFHPSLFNSNLEPSNEDEN